MSPEFLVFVAVPFALILSLVVAAGARRQERTPPPKPDRPVNRRPNPRLFGSPPPPAQTEKRRPGSVVSAGPRRIRGHAHVIDGDTMMIGRVKVRLAGIDAPELDQPWGQKAKWAVVHMVKGQTVIAELNGEVSHDRFVGTCYLPDGRDIGAELVRQGLALDWPLFSGDKYRHLEPRGARRRLWGCGHYGHRPAAANQPSQRS